MKTYLALEYDLPQLIEKRKIKLSSAMKTSGKMDVGYSECLEKAKNKKMSLCPEGYCTAKEKFEVYPSAYANAYASQVCSGKKPDLEGKTINRYGTSEKKSDSGLNRWFSEKWVNVCEKDSKGEYKPCGRKKADLSSENYPYCRPLNKLAGTQVKTVGELSQGQIQTMCEKKRSLEQGIDNKPTRVYLPK